MLSVGNDSPVGAGIVAWLILAIAWFATIGVRPLLEPDEGRYAEIPREMHASGDWVTPRLNGVKYFEKPALQYWATAAAYSVFGVSEWTARLWSSALAFLCIPLVFGFARWLHDSAGVGVAAASVLAINPYFAIVGQINLLDSGFCFFLSAAMFAFVRRWMIVTAACLGFAVLMKGIAALVLAGGAMACYLAITRDFRVLRGWRLPVSLPVFLLVTAPWFAVVSARNPEFPEFFFIHEHFTRFLTDEADRVQPWWYFLPFVLIAILPWVTSLRAVRIPKTWDERSRAQAFLLAWCVFVVFFFSISHSKLATYLMPMIPALAVLLAPMVALRVRALRQAVWIVAGLVVLVAAALLIGASRRADVIPGTLMLWCVAAVVVAVACGVFVRRSWLVASVAALLAFQSLLVAYAELPPVRTSRQLVAAARPYIGPNTELFSVNQYRQTIAPYLGRTLRMVGFQGELQFGLAQAGASSGFVQGLEQFAEVWRASSDAVAFIEPAAFSQLAAHGVPMREIARDGRSVAVTRKAEPSP